MEERRVWKPLNKAGMTEVLRQASLRHLRDQMIAQRWYAARFAAEMVDELSSGQMTVLRAEK
jgi:hypothetical protein